MDVATRGELWWDSRKPEQHDLFESWINLGEEFYQAIIAHPFPLDMRTLKELKKSPFVLDLYAWLAYRSERIRKTGKPVFISWWQLREQVGANYSDIKNFKKKFKPHLRMVLAAYPELRVEDVSGGLKIAPSPRLITSL